MLFHIELARRKAIETQQHIQARGQCSEDNSRDSFVDLSQVFGLMSANAKVPYCTEVGIISPGRQDFCAKITDNAPPFRERLARQYLL